LTKLWQEEQEKWQQQQQQRERGKHQAAGQELVEGEESMGVEGVVLGMPPDDNSTVPI
jgi:hypothetical protein